MLSDRSELLVAGAPLVMRLNIDRDRTAKELKHHQRWLRVGCGAVLGPRYFADFLSFANKICSTAVLSVMTCEANTMTVQTALTVLGEPSAQRITRSTLVNYGPEATVYEFAFQRAWITNFLAINPDVRAWQAPELPEDLVLLRADGSIFFQSLVHEEDAFVGFRPDELRRARTQQESWLTCAIGTMGE